jgi:hypothetical protein
MNNRDVSTEDFSVIQYLPYWSGNILDNLKEEIKRQEQYNQVTAQIEEWRIVLSKAIDRLDHPKQDVVIETTVVEQFTTSLLRKINSAKVPDALFDSYKLTKQLAEGTIERCQKMREAATSSITLDLD